MASLHEDLGLYVLGALEDPQEFEVHLETCAECREELRQIRGAIDVVAANTTHPVPPSGLRDRTLAALRAGREAPPAPVVSLAAERNRRRRFAGIAAVAALAVVVAGLGYRTFTRDSFSADRVFALAAPDGGPARGTAKIDDTESGQVIELTVSGLPTAPAGTYYECWWVGPDDADDIQDRVSAGTFRGGDGTYRMQSSADPSHFTKMGVTLEPDDGNPARTGQKVLTSAPPPGSSPAASAPPTPSPATPASAAPSAPPSAAAPSP
jgi:hypothetical protein